MSAPERYDYTIVGGGTAGCILATRLSRDPGIRVLLLEAGDRDWNPFIRVPFTASLMFRRGWHDWGYESDPELGLGGRRLEAARGKVLGGSSSTNFISHNRGHMADFDAWAESGADSWSYEELLPYFKRSETWQDGASDQRGGAGPLPVEKARLDDPLFSAWTQAAAQRGIFWNPDIASGDSEGIGHGQYAILQGRRASASRAYLRSAARRSNLTVRTNARATKILFEGNRAVGVEYTRGGGRGVHRAFARCEVVASAGTFNSAQLLMLSGVGPAADLLKHGIAPVSDLPVGENLQDHFSITNLYSRLGRGPVATRMRLDRFMWAVGGAYLFGRGPGTIAPNGLLAFVKSSEERSSPDIELMFPVMPADARPWVPVLRPAYVDAFGVRPALLHPRSRGHVKLRSSDPSAPPRITFGVLQQIDDLRDLIAALRLSRDLAAEPALDPFRGDELAPGRSVRSDADLSAFIRRTVQTVHHPCGTCRMGVGPESVVDPELRVRGLEGLRVVDASVMPTIPGAHINATVVAIAERAADLILDLRPESVTTHSNI